MSKTVGFKYYRYCDDLLIVCKTEKVKYLVKEVMAVIKENFHLTIQTKKSEIVEFRPNSKGIIRSFDINKPDGRKTTAITEQKHYKTFNI